MATKYRASPHLNYTIEDAALLIEVSEKQILAAIKDGQLQLVAAHLPKRKFVSGLTLRRLEKVLVDAAAADRLRELLKTDNAKAKNENRTFLRRTNAFLLEHHRAEERLKQERRAARAVTKAARQTMEKLQNRSRQ